MFHIVRRIDFCYNGKGGNMRQWDRLELLLGGTGVLFLSTKTVLIVGLGGVGGYVVESLARMGIGHLILVDFDGIDVTNINRQIIALHSQIGRKKTDVWKARVLDINPYIKVDIFDLFVTKGNLPQLFNRPVDFVIDACDTITTKEALITFTQTHQIPFLSCMGTGRRLDPTKVTILPLGQTNYDPLAKKLRSFIRKQNLADIMTVCSTEIPSPATGGKIASSIFVPATAGLFASYYVVQKLLGDRNE